MGNVVRLHRRRAAWLKVRQRQARRSAALGWQEIVSRCGPAGAERLRHLHPDHLSAAPIECLGRRDDFFFFRDAQGSLRALRRLGPRTIAGLFTGHEEWLVKLWPNRRGTGFDRWKAAETLIVACSHYGLVYPGDLGVKVRLPRLQ